MVQVGAQLQDVGNEIYRAQKIEEERINMTRAESALNDFITAEQDLTTGEKKGFSYQRGANAVTKPLHADYTGQLAEARKRIEDGLTNDRQKELFRSRADTVIHRFNGNLNRHIAHESDVYSKQVFESSKVAELANIGANYANPMTFATSVNRIGAAIDREAERLGMVDLKDGEKSAFLDRAWKARLDAWRLADPTGALATFLQNSDAISPALRVQLGESLFLDAAPILAAQVVQSAGLRTVAANAAEAEAIARIADAMGMEASVEVNPEKVAKSENLFDRLPGDQKLKILQLAHTQAQQGMAQLRESMGFRVQDAIEALERGLTAPDVPSRDELVRVFGQERGGRISQSLDASRQFGSDVARLSTMSAEEMVKLLDSRAAQPGPGFALEQKRQDELRGAANRVLTERVRDPAAVAMQHSRAVSSTYQRMAAQPTPENAQAFAQTMLAEQKRLGIAEPVLLPKANADALSKQFADTSEGAQKPTQLVQQQAAMWGPYWPQVYRQIAKDISPTARVVSNLRDTPAANLLSMNAKLKTSELKQGIQATDAKDIDEALTGQLEPFRRSLVGWTTQGSATYNDFEEAAKRNAYVYVAQGQSPRDAAARASRELVNDYYSFVGTTRIPVAAGVDPLSAQRGMDAVLRDAAKLDLPIPESAAKVLGKEFTGKQIGASIRDNGFFVTLGDDSGVALFLKGKDGNHALEGADGHPITFTWRDLANRGTEALKAQPLTFGETEGGAVAGATRRPRAQYAGGGE